MNRELLRLLDDVPVSKIRKIQPGSAFFPCRGEMRTASVNQLVKGYVKRPVKLDASNTKHQVRRTGSVAQVAGEKTGTVYDGRCLAVFCGQWTGSLLPGACHHHQPHHQPRCNAGRRSSRAPQCR